MIGYILRLDILMVVIVSLDINQLDSIQLDN